ncbi:MAG: metal-dependent hydrolase [Anaerolineae bacterium]
MKGIAHFVTGIALATLFPQVVGRASEGSLLPVIGGIAGILPDTIDFKFLRYFEQHTLEIDPGPDPDPWGIAEQVAAAMRRAYESGESQDVMLHTIRLGGDLWRQYTIRFDSERGEVAVRVGPVVSTGQVPLPGSEPQDGEEARIKVGPPMAQTYPGETDIDIFSGPSFRFERQADALQVRFLPWHRRWSHSVTLAAALALGTSGLWALHQLLVDGRSTSTSLWAGVVVGLGLLGHILEDQLGFMGSNLLYPFTRARTRGLGLLRSGDAIPNFLTVWSAAMLIVFNLDRFSAQPGLIPPWLLGTAVALPVVVLGGVYHLQRRAWPRSQEVLQQLDIISETEDIELA